MPKIVADVLMERFEAVVASVASALADAYLAKVEHGVIVDDEYVVDGELVKV